MEIADFASLLVNDANQPKCRTFSPVKAISVHD